MSLVFSTFWHFARETIDSLDFVKNVESKSNMCLCIYIYICICIYFTYIWNICFNNFCCRKKQNILYAWVALWIFFQTSRNIFLISQNIFGTWQNIENVFHKIWIFNVSRKSFSKLKPNDYYFVSTVVNLKFNPIESKCFQWINNAHLVIYPKIIFQSLPATSTSRLNSIKLNL